MSYGPVFENENGHTPAGRVKEHRCFVIDVSGTPMHVQGDPNMSEETVEALRNLGEAVLQMIEEGKL